MTDPDLVAVRARAGGSLPDEYEAFLRWSDGGEARLGASYLLLWSAKEVVELNQLYEVANELPGCLAVGTDGGPHLLVYLDPMKSSHVALVPFDDMSLEEADSTWPSLSDMAVGWMANEEVATGPSWGDRVDVFVVRMPAKGLAGLAALRKALALDCGLTALRSLCQDLPACVQRDVHYGQTLRRLEEAGVDLDAIELRLTSADPLVAE